MMQLLEKRRFERGLIIKLEFKNFVKNFRPVSLLVYQLNMLIRSERNLVEMYYQKRMLFHGIVFLFMKLRDIFLYYFGLDHYFVF
jgi:hypothetical protein